MPEQPRWFALSTKPKHEQAAARVLANKGVGTFVPTCRCRRAWSDRVKVVELPLFPGYVFCRMEACHRTLVLATPGVTAILSFGGKPSPVADAEIAALRSMVASGMRLEPWTGLRPGERVRVERGSLRGLEGTLVRDKTGLRVVVNVELLQRGVAVELDRAALRPAAA